ncbi:MAG: hypothetical protein CUN55_18065, partial [Phototrophicales bacterium]
ALVYNVLNTYASEKRWRKDFVSDGQQKVFIIDTPSSQYEALFVSNPDLTGANSLIVFITDTTKAKTQIEYAKHIYIITGLIATLVALALVIAVLWRPIRSLQRQARALPLLAQGKYDEVRQRLQKNATRKIFDDEISQLQDASLKLTEQLSDFHQQLMNNSHKLHEMAHFD